LGFLNPIFLLGILAAAVPLIIHLWRRHQAKTVDFSSLMFLLAAHRQNVRRIQLKHLLILVLRVLIIILIALALARPLLKNRFAFAGARTKTSVVIILDNSYSMGYQGIQGGRFEIAREMALAVAQSLQRGDSASVILMSDIPDPLFPKLTKDLNQVREAIRQSQISYRATLIPPSLEMAHDILEASNDPNKEIYLISDFNRNGWTRWDHVPNRSGARIFLLPLNDEVTDNISIEEVRASNQLIGLGLPVELGAVIGVHSDASSVDTVLTLFIDEQKRRSISPQVGAGESVTLTFTHQFELPGTHTGYLELTADRLPLDNRRYFALDAYGQIRVLCVGDQTMYLALALNPAVQGQPNMDSPFLPATASLEALEDLTLTEYDILILADVPAFSTRVQQQLQAFMRAGKSVIYFVGAGVDTASYNAFADWLPASVGQPITWQPPVTLSSYREDSPIFEVFKGEDFTGQYAPQFYHGLELEPAGDAKIVAQFSDGTPFLIEHSINRGIALLFNVSAARSEASNLLVSPHFLPLLQQAVLYTEAIQSGHQRNLIVGAPYTANYRWSGATTAHITRLGDTTHSSETLSLAEDGALTFSGTDAPGIYQVEGQGRDALLRDFFAVNVDATESELQPIPIQEAADRIGAQTEVISESEALEQTLNTYRVGVEIWSELLLIALILMLIEGILSNRESMISDDSVPSRT
jgi:hypothetical protein